MLIRVVDDHNRYAKSPGTDPFGKKVCGDLANRQQLLTVRCSSSLVATLRWTTFTM